MYFKRKKWVISVKAVHMVFWSGLFIIAIKKVHSEQPDLLSADVITDEDIESTSHHKMAK